MAFTSAILVGASRSSVWTPVEFLLFANPGWVCGASGLPKSAIPDGFAGPEMILRDKGWEIPGSCSAPRFAGASLSEGVVASL
jgi:hypothetical protein